MPGTLHVVATPIGNLEDITYRAVRLLGEVALIAAEDTRRIAKLLRHYGITTRTTSFHEHNERRKTGQLMARLAAGDSIALVIDAGTPLLSDPGARLVRAAIAEGLRVEAVPGPSAILAALVTSGLVEDSFTFVGFPPGRSRARRQWLSALSAEPRPLVLFEAPHRIRATLADMLEILGDRLVVICRELTKLHEESFNGPISDVIERLTQPRGEFTIVVGPPGPEMTGRFPTLTGRQAYKELGQLTETGMARREAVNTLARKYGLANRRIYQLIEQGKPLLGQST